MQFTIDSHSMQLYHQYMEQLISIAAGNSKLGRIPNVSLVPGRDCGNCAHCVKACYARKFFKMYPSVRTAWSKNSVAAHSSLRLYFRAIDAYIAKRAPKYFRFHVAGDILSQTYLGNMCKLARRYPGTAFLAFTKMHGLDYSNLPSNLTIVASMWPNQPIPAAVANLPKAWMQDGSETRIPADAIPCPGTCDQCGMCWALPQLGRDVVFHKH